MNANELADELVWMAKNRGDSISRQLADIVRQQQEKINNLQQWERRHLDVIKSLEERIERMIENQSHHEGIAHAGGFEVGYQAAKAKTLTDEEIDFITKRYFNIHPEAKLSEQFRIKLYEIEDFAKTILRKAQEK